MSRRSRTLRRSNRSKLAPGYVSAREEFGDGRAAPTQEFLDERLSEGHRQAAAARAEAQLMAKARRVLDGRADK